MCSAFPAHFHLGMKMARRSVDNREYVDSAVTRVWNRVLTEADSRTAGCRVT